MSERKAKDLQQQVINELQTIYDEREAIAVAKAYLSDRFGIESIDIALNKVSDIDEKHYKADLTLLKKGTPLQHVVGFGHFLDYQFKCSKDALVPRPETEELVLWILDQNQFKSGTKMLDIGTGTGCIPISIALAKPDWQISGLDISEAALALAHENAQDLNAHVDFWQYDVLSGHLPEHTYDIIVSNPPYIPESEKVQMHKNVADYDPGLALFVPDSDPLLFYRKIAEESKIALKKGALLFFEIHEDFGEQTASLLKGFGYQNIELRKDINGKDRMIKAQKV